MIRPKYLAILLRHCGKNVFFVCKMGGGYAQISALTYSY